MCGKPTTEYTAVYTAVLGCRGYLRLRRSFGCSSCMGECQGYYSCALELRLPASDPSSHLLNGHCCSSTDIYKAASNFASYFDKLSKWFIKLESCFPRYTEYQFLFGGAPRLQRALCEFYATVIRFCQKSIQIVQRTGEVLFFLCLYSKESAAELTRHIQGVAQFAKSLWKSYEREFGAFEVELERQSKDVQEEIGLASEIVAARERQLQVAERKAQSQHRNFGRLFHDKLDRFTKEEMSWKLEDAERKAKVQKQFLLDKLSTYDYISPLKQVRKKRYGTTSTWLTKTIEYEMWLNESGSSFFWLSGILGSGKSVLTGALIDELLCNQLTDNASVGFFFCQHDHRESLEAQTVLRSLTRQFLTVENMSETMQNQLERLFTSPLFSDDELKLFLECALNPSRKHFIVVDGFDECSPQDRRFILSVLKETSSRSIIKMFVTSRHDSGREIEKAFVSRYSQSMDCQEVHEDIEVYIRTTIEEKKSMEDLVVGDAELLHEIEDALMRGAHGMSV